MLAFRLTQTKDNGNSESCPRWLRRHQRNHHWHCYYCGCPRSTFNVLPPVMANRTYLHMKWGKNRNMAAAWPGPCRFRAERTGEPGDFRLRQHHILNDCVRVTPESPPESKVRQLKTIYNHYKLCIALSLRTSH